MGDGWWHNGIRRGLTAAAAALLCVTVVSACSRTSGGEGSGGKQGSGGKNEHGLPAASSTAEPMGACLTAHGVPASVMGALLGNGPDASAGPAARPSQQTLRDAGVACWPSISSSATGSVLQSVVTCVAGRGVATAQTGSALADLLLLDPASATVRQAVAACQPSGHAGGK
jgi:hypothetical protein